MIIPTTLYYRKRAILKVEDYKNKTFSFASRSAELYPRKSTSSDWVYVFIIGCNSRGLSGDMTINDNRETYACQYMT